MAQLSLRKALAAQSRKRVLILSPLHGVGGTERHLSGLAKLLREQRADVTVACRIRSQEAPLDWFRRELGLKLITTPFSSRWPRAAMAWAIYVWPRILPAGFDVLYTLDMSRVVKVLARLVKPSGYVIANRVGAPPIHEAFADPAAERVFDGFVAETESQLAGYPTAVPKRAIPQIPLEPKPLLRLNATGRRLRVAYLGRYERAKGIFRAIDIWRQAQPEDAELSFYGMGPHRRELEQYISSRAFEGKVSVHDGWKTSEEQASILSTVDLVILPSEDEGLPLTLLESLAHGVPFIAADVGGICELARDNPDVSVLRLDNSQFAACLNHMLLRIRRGEISSERLRSYYRQRYSSERIHEQWREALLEPESFWGPRASRAAANGARR